MMGTETANAGLCTSCGSTLTGKFCSGCGAPASALSAEHEGWSGLTSQLLSKPDRNGLFSVVLAFLRHPVDTIIRLTDDSTYHSHWGFLTACVGAQLTLVYVLLPRLFSALFNTPDTANGAAVITTEIVQYVGMAILTPIQYYVCRALGTLRRTPLSYVKLCVLSVSYGALLSSVAALVFFAIGVLVLKMQVSINIAMIWQGLSLMVLASILAFVSASHRRFWGMTWPIAIGVTLAIATLSWTVVYPGLTSLAESLDVSGTIGRFFG